VRKENYSVFFVQVDLIRGGGGVGEKRRLGRRPERTMQRSLLRRYLTGSSGRAAPEATAKGKGCHRFPPPKFRSGATFPRT